MRVIVSQLYPEARTWFPFTQFFQSKLSDWLSQKASMWQVFDETYGTDYTLIFRMSAKRDISQTEIVGPTVFRRTKDVEYTIFLPFDGSLSYDNQDLLLAATRCVTAVSEILTKLQICVDGIAVSSDSFIKELIVDPKSVEEPK